MRYEQKVKTKLYKQIVRYKRNHPELSNEEIGQKFGLTRQRISQIFLKYEGNANLSPEAKERIWDCIEQGAKVKE